MFSGFFQVFVELGNLHGTSTYDDIPKTLMTKTIKLCLRNLDN